MQEAHYWVYTSDTLLLNVSVSILAQGLPAFIRSGGFCFARDSAKRSYANPGRLGGNAITFVSTGGGNAIACRPTCRLWHSPPPVPPGDAHANKNKEDARIMKSGQEHAKIRRPMILDSQRSSALVGVLQKMHSLAWSGLGHCT